MLLNREILTKRLISISGDIRRLSETVTAMKEINIPLFPELYEAQSVEAAQRAEWIALRLRELVYMTTNIRKRDYLSCVAETMEIKIEDHEGIYEITLPGLMPKRKSRKGTAYLIDPLYAALNEFIREHHTACLVHCTVCFVLVYDRALSERRIRDYDNLELKEVLDAVASCLMVNDGGLLCDAYQTTELGDADCTRIFIMDTERYPEWYARRKALKGSGNPGC